MFSNCIKSTLEELRGHKVVAIMYFVVSSELTFKESSNPYTKLLKSGQLCGTKQFLVFQVRKVF